MNDNLKSSPTINTAKISIITPLFNDSLYLSECFDSILSQSYSNWELICVDDCSTDGTYDKLLDYQAKDKRFKVHKMQKNMGSGIARNIALDMATGDYITFIDSDDKYASSEVLQNYINAFKDETIDAVCSNALGLDGNLDENNILYKEEPFICKAVIGTPEDFVNTGFFWRFIFKTTVIQNKPCRFPKYRRRQDPVFFAKTMTEVKRILFLTDICYLHRANYKKIDYTDELIYDWLSSHEETLSILISTQYKNHIMRDYKAYIHFLCQILFPLFFIKKVDLKIFKTIQQTHIRMNDTLKLNGLKGKSLPIIIGFYFPILFIKKLIMDILLSVPFLYRIKQKLRSKTIKINSAKTPY